MSPSRRYLVIAFATGLGLVATVVGVNRLVDPYWVHDAPGIAGLNLHRTEFGHHVRLGKSWRIARLKPAALILGSSRADVALDPQHASFRAQPVFNAALPGANLHELRRMFEYAHALRPLDQVVLAADFFMFNSTYPVRADFSEGRLGFGPERMQDWASTLVSLDAFVDSLATVREQYARDDWLDYTPAGHHDWTHAEWHLANLGGPSAAFREVIEHMPRLWRPFPERRYQLGGDSGIVGTSDALVDYRRILERAHDDGIALHVVILPVHVALLDALREMDLSDEYEAWKRELVAIHRDVARARATDSFPLWDFTGHAIAQEPVPDGRDATMRYFWDAGHVTSEVGGRVLDRVLGSGSRSLDDGFGARLDSPR